MNEERMKERQKRVYFQSFHQFCENKKVTSKQVANMTKGADQQHYGCEKKVTTGK